MTVKTEDTPHVSPKDRISIEPAGGNFWRVRMSFGYMETPNIPRGLALLRKQGFTFDIMATSFFLSRRSIRPAVRSAMPLVAGQAVHRPRQDGHGRDRLLPDPDRPCG